MAYRALVWVRDAREAVYLRQGVRLREVLLTCGALSHDPDEATQQLHQAAVRLMPAQCVLVPHDARVADGDAGRFRVCRSGRVYHEPGTGDGWWDPWRCVPIEPVERVERGLWMEAES